MRAPSRCCLGFAAALGLLAVASAARDDDGIVRRFVHQGEVDDVLKGHVQTQWFTREAKQEVPRDCRGCHVFGETASVEPQDVCARCHYAGEFELAGDGSLAALHDEVDIAGFEHFDHLRLACRECHLEPDVRGAERMVIPTSVAECERCHADDAATTLAEMEWIDPQQREPANPDWKRDFYAALNDAQGMRPDALGPFRHADHVLEPSSALSLAAAAETCKACHAGVYASTATFGADVEYDDASCGECHVDAPDSRQEFTSETEQRPSRAAFTFDHVDHLAYARDDADAAAASGYTRLEESGCHACHAYDPALPIPDYAVARTAALAQPAWSYEGCIECHALEPWNAPSDLPKGHSGWADEVETRPGTSMACTDCHLFGAPDMAGTRALVQVQRPRPTTFLVESQRHPFITGSELGEAADCADCHFAPVPELPSRIVEKRFNHTTHLPDLASTPLEDVLERCADCHAANVAKAASSQDIGRVYGDTRGLSKATSPQSLVSPATGKAPPTSPYGLTYDPAACVDCHFGDEIVAKMDDVDRAPRRAVTDFPHDAHIGKWLPGGEIATCVTCHVDVESPSYDVFDDRTNMYGDVGVLLGAATCEMCHRHEGELAAITGGAGRASVSSCAECHADAVPALDPAEHPTVARVVGASFGVSGSQFHPVDQACNACHLPGSIVREAPAVARVGTLGKEWDPNTSTSDIHERGRYPLEQSDQCLDCHWYRQIGSVEANPRKEDVRRRLGNKLETSKGLPYPGVTPP